MSTKFSKAFLMSGKDYKLTSNITLHHPTIDEILSIDHSPFSDSLYYLYVQTLLADPYSNMVMLDDLGKNYMEVSPYEVFAIQWDNCMSNYSKNKELYTSYNINPLDNICNALKFFICEKPNFNKGMYEDGSVCFYDINNHNCQINKEIFEYIYEWVKGINKIEFSDQIKPSDENARKILIEDMRNEIKKSKRRKKKKNDDGEHLGNILSAVCFCGNGSISPFNLNNAKIYWINEALSISNKKNKADHILNGIYQGTINSKEINKNDIDWVN